MAIQNPSKDKTKAKRAKRSQAACKVQEVPEPTAKRAQVYKTKPRIEFDLQNIEEYAAKGLSLKAIAGVVGCSEDTVYTRNVRDPEFRAAIARGRARAELKAANKLGDLIEESNPQAVMFFLKTRCDWREGVNLSADVVSENHNTNLNVAVKLEDLTEAELLDMINRCDFEAGE